MTKTALKLYDKLLEIATVVDEIEKKGWNSHGEYWYIKATDLMRKVRSEFIQRKLFMSTSVVSCNDWSKETGKQSVGVTVITSHTITDAESGEYLTFQSAGQGVDSGDKAIYKALTGAIKYAIRDTFLIPDATADPEREDDKDKPDEGPKALPKEKSGKTAKGARGKTDTDQAGNDGELPLSDRKRLFAIVRGREPEASEEAVKAMVKRALKQFGWDSTTQVPQSRYEELCDFLAKGNLDEQ